jgi:hypothetical protein
MRLIFLTSLAMIPKTKYLAMLAMSACALPVNMIHAQGRPAGAGRPWLELGLGGSRQDPNCAACFQRMTMAGPSATAAVGLTITPTFGVAVLGRAFGEFSYDYTHRASYYLALAQYSPAASAPWLTLNAGFGLGQQHDDDNGSGRVIAGGAALRLTAQSTFGLALTADWIKSLSGTLQTTAGRPTSSYRPLLFTLGLSLNIAGDNPEKPR